MRILITGGAGFVGTNLAAHLADMAHEVIVFDNFSRQGVVANAEWLGRNYPGIAVEEGDVRDFERVAKLVARVDAVFHLAAQVAVTTSVIDPRSDFDINLLGTLNVLEAVRLHAPHAPVFYTSTNKVYGGMEDQKIVLRNDRYEYEALPGGVPESRPLDFHSPYGCSKGAADQYVHDYGRIFGLRTVVFRMSCIYGPHQCGNEDQGWVAHFARETLAGGELTIFGDGRQVRDILYVEDLVGAFSKALAAIDVTAGRVYNMGGGPENTISLLELIAELEAISGRSLRVSFNDWRPGDQRVYVTNVSRARDEFGWQPQTDKRMGVRRLLNWFRDAATESSS